MQKEHKEETVDKQGLKADEKKVAIGYTVKAITPTVDRLKQAGLINENEYEGMKNVIEKVIMRYFTGTTV